LLLGTEYSGETISRSKVAFEKFMAGFNPLEDNELEIT
jgi:hypothetical protein